MRVKSKDFWAGSMFIGIGLAFACSARQYELGTGARMGPGSFPTVLGILLLLLGILVCLRARAHTSPDATITAIGWRELLLILSSVALFGFTLPWLGMIGAVALLVLVSALAGHEFDWKEAAGLVIGLLILSYLLFVEALELQLPVWPTFLID